MGRGGWKDAGIERERRKNENKTHLTLPKHPIHLRPPPRPALPSHPRGLQHALAQRPRRLPRVIVRDLAAHVVQDVRLGDAARRPRADPPHERAGVAEEAAVERGEGAAREGVLRGAVVREEGVGVLEEGDEDEPVVDPGW